MELKRGRGGEKENVYAGKEDTRADALSRENDKLSLRLKAMEMEVKSCEAERVRLAELNDLYVKKLSEGRMDSEGPLGQG